jgi:hypothetical protein
MVFLGNNHGSAKAQLICQKLLPILLENGFRNFLTEALVQYSSEGYLVQRSSDFCQVDEKHSSVNDLDWIINTDIAQDQQAYMSYSNKHPHNRYLILNGTPNAVNAVKKLLVTAKNLGLDIIPAGILERANGQTLVDAQDNGITDVLNGYAGPSDRTICHVGDYHARKDAARGHFKDRSISISIVNINDPFANKVYSVEHNSIKYAALKYQISKNDLPVVIKINEDSSSADYVIIVAE